MPERTRPPRVMPWDAMTDQQQYDHLRAAHRMGTDTLDRDRWHAYDHGVPLDEWPRELRHTHDKPARD